MKANIPRGMGGGPGNMQAMLRQAQKMQEDAQRVQSELEETQYDSDDDPAFRTEKRNLRFRFRYPDKEAVTAEVLDISVHRALRLHIRQA